MGNPLPEIDFNIPWTHKDVFKAYYLRADVAASNNRTAAESSNASIEAAKVRAMKAGGMVVTESEGAQDRVEHRCIALS
jgi:hypothetical protein